MILDSVNLLQWTQKNIIPTNIFPLDIHIALSELALFLCYPSMWRFLFLMFCSGYSCVVGISDINCSYLIRDMHALLNMLHYSIRIPKTIAIKLNKGNIVFIPKRLQQTIKNEIMMHSALSVIFNLITILSFWNIYKVYLDWP